MKYFRIFGSTCFILKDRENVGKFDSWSDEGIFLGYSSTSKAYQVYNKRTMKVMETVNVVIVEQELASPSTPGTPSVVEDSADILTSPDSESYEEKGPSSRIKLNHPPKVIVRNMNEFTIRKRTVDKCVANFVSYSCYLS